MRENVTVIPFRSLPPCHKDSRPNVALVMGLIQLSDEAEALGHAAIAQILLGAASILADRPLPGHSGSGSYRT